MGCANNRCAPTGGQATDRDSVVRGRAAGGKKDRHPIRLAVEVRIAHTLFRQPVVSVVSDQAQCFFPITSREVSMAKDKESGVYTIVDVVGVSSVSWEDAAKRAVETAAKSLRDLRIAEVTKMDLKVEDGKVLAFRTRVALSFKYEG
jgi:flavin-binding protein dodecin